MTRSEPRSLMRKSSSLMRKMRRMELASLARLGPHPLALFCANLSGRYATFNEWPKRTDSKGLVENCPHHWLNATNGGWVDYGSCYSTTHTHTTTSTNNRLDLVSAQAVDRVFVISVDCLAGWWRCTWDASISCCCSWVQVPDLLLILASC